MQENWLKGWPDEDDRLATLGLKNGDEVSIEFDDGVVTKGHIQQRTGAPPWILKKTQGVNEELIIKISSQTGIS